MTVPLRCSTCRREFGYTTPTTKDRDAAIYCRPYCAVSRRVSDNEVRDAIIAYLHLKDHDKWRALSLGFEFELSRQRVEQILSERGVLYSLRLQGGVGGKGNAS